MFVSCSGIERSENEKIRRRNCRGEYIHRKSGHSFYVIETPLHTPRDAYPWEGSIPRITKEFFRCKGSALHPPLLDTSDPANHLLLRDCDGRHGLPIIHGQEGVYPILIDLLNEIQKETHHRVIITSGHRCPAHNSYVDPSKENRISKHQIGAEVDFYVEGMEKSPLEVVRILDAQFPHDPLRLIDEIWSNKEILLKISETKNFDNSASHAYLTLQVRFDRARQERVCYEWKKAHLDYPH